jgi:release factor glutamine methyltransferase
VTLSLLIATATQRLINAEIPPDEARVEARMLVQYAFGLTREQLILRSDSPVTEDRGQTQALETLIARRASREPLAYIVGERAFYGLSFRVTPAVLIPRPETEHLVEVALNPLREAAPRGYPGRRLSGGERQKSGGERLLDIGTGSGCIAVTLAKCLPDAKVWATEISEAALEVARENAARHGALVEFRLGDLLAPLPTELRFEVIVSNPPYIASTEASTLEPEVRDFEPHTALFDTAKSGDGLSFYRRLGQEAPARLVAGGLLAVEVGQGQDLAVAQLWQGAGLEDVTVTPDLAGIGRVVSGRRP